MIFNRIIQVLHPMMRWVINITYVGVGLGTIGLVLLYRNQNSLLYFPSVPNMPKTPGDNPRMYRSPGEWSTIGGRATGASDAIPYEDAILTTKDGASIHTWLMLQPDHSTSNPYPTLIYFHGNAGNMGFRLPNAVRMFTKSKINILMMDYRGYGHSTGVPTEDGLNTDADCVLEYALAHPRLHQSPIILFGRSLGGAVSVALAHRYGDKVHAVVLENTFISIAAMVDVLMPYISWAKKYVLRIGWDSGLMIQSLQQPILFISGDSDQLVPPSHMKALYESAVASRLREFFSVAGGTHNDTWEVAGMNYYTRLREFIAASLGVQERVKQEDSQMIEGQEEEEVVVSENMLPTMGTDFVVR